MHSTTTARQSWQLTLKPNAGREVLLGLYEKGLSSPQFEIRTEPEPGDDLKYSIARLNEAGEYRLVCYLQNFSAQTCHVTITEKDV